ncbi:MAG: ETC complex I subunit [Phyllobacteriaceae bacterium]|nr:ETC complex I subunit [Phyllobacteriaceae bacterium]
MVARIFRPAKTAMQSGRAKTKRWVLEWEPETAKTADPLMGWTSSSDMKGQLRLFFETKEEAVAYATRKNLDHRVIDPQERSPKTVSYSDNFKFGRVGVWTH